MFQLLTLSKITYFPEKVFKKDNRVKFTNEILIDKKYLSSRIIVINPHESTQGGVLL